jgi:starch synthase
LGGTEHLTLETGHLVNVLFLSVEVAPFAKTGGLGDVAGALPKALHQRGVDVRVCMPLYQEVSREHLLAEPAVPKLGVPIGNRTTQVAIRQGHLTYGAHEADSAAVAAQSEIQNPQSKIASVPVYFVESAHYFDRQGIYGHHDDGERFLVYARAALELCRSLGWKPDVVHCNDWHTGIVPNWLETLYKDDPFFAGTASVFTIHNLAYQGLFEWYLLELAGLQEQGFLYPQIEELQHTADLLGRGILFADVVNTVSERYAEEILTPEYGERLDPLLRDRKDRLFGILNGIDEEELDPHTDPHLPVRFGARTLADRAANKAALQREAGLPEAPDVPIIAMIGRLSGQKGLDILMPVLDGVLRQPVQFILLGTGDEHYHHQLRQAAERHPDRTAVFLTFNTPLAQRIYGSSDIFLMPSRYEPCGLGQLIAMRYGTVAVVRATGGLADTVQDYDPRTGEGNGFTFAPYDSLDLFAALMRALETYRHADDWRTLQLRGMASDFSWRRSAGKYLELYEKAIGYARA